MFERRATEVLLLLVTLASWAWLLAGAGMDMAAMAAMADMVGPMGPWSAADAALMLAMWVVMMAAMMLPSATPAVLAIAGVGRGSAVPFAAGYLLAWSGFAMAATVAQWALDQAAVLSHAMALANRLLAAAVLILAGIWQLTPWKQACLRHCRSPMDLLLHRWRDGIRGGVRMGAEHGLYCLGCCWALMLLLFVGGVMSFAWIGGLALYVLIEKTVPAAHWLGRLAGIALIGWGGLVLLNLAAGSAG
jgi:predicted metal-binding membrane protein